MIRERFPHGGAPSIDCTRPIISRISPHHLDRGDTAAIFRQRKPWPLPLHPGEFHVRELHFPASESPLEVQVKTGQAEVEPDRFALSRRVLSGPCIDDVLVNELGITKR